MKKILILLVTFFCLPMAMLADDAISMNVVKNNDTSWTLNVDLTNSLGSYTGCQMDFVLPAGFTADATSLTAATRLTGFTLQANTIEGGNVRVVVYSSIKTKRISGNSGTLFSINLSAQSVPTAPTFTVTAKNIRFTTGTNEYVLPGITETFSINDTKTYTLTYYNGNDVYYTTQLEAGAPIPTIEEPEPQTGYSFCGWGEVPEQMPDSALDLHAVWCVNYYTVYYVVDSDTIYFESVEYGKPFELYNKYIPAAGYKVGAWQGEIYETMPAHEVMYQAYTTKIGDVNLDGILNSGDVVSVYNFIASGSEETGILFDNADVNADGTVNAADVASVYNLISGN